MVENQDKQQGDTDEGVIYILQNDAMRDYIKIGTTRDLPERMRSLDSSSSVPFPFSCVHASKVRNARAWERALHEAFSEERASPRREFFDASIAPRVIMLLRAGHILDVTNTAPMTVEADESPSETKRNGNRRERFTFDALGIGAGEILTFTASNEDEEEVCCMVSKVRPPRVIYDDVEMTLAEATGRAFKASRSMTGLAYWCYEGESLLARRRRLEESEDDE